MSSPMVACELAREDDVYAKPKPERREKEKESNRVKKEENRIKVKYIQCTSSE